MSVQMRRIAIIGAGNLGRSLIGGLINSGVPRGLIFATNRNPIKRSAIAKDFGIKVYESNKMVAESETIILGVKPQDIQFVCKEISQVAQTSKPLFISLAAGVRVKDMERWLGYEASIVRTASNTPALLGEGATALLANQFVSEQAKEYASTLLKSTGKTAWVKSEAELDAITALVSSGPAYHFLFMELLAKAAVQMGIDPKTAQEMSIQTAYGASLMARKTDVSLSDLRRAVTTPNGVTHQAITHFEKAGLGDICIEAMKAAQRKCTEFSIAFSKDKPVVEGDDNQKNLRSKL